MRPLSFRTRAAGRSRSLPSTNWEISSVALGRFTERRVFALLEVIMNLAAGDRGSRDVGRAPEIARTAHPGDINPHCRQALSDASGRERREGNATGNRSLWPATRIGPAGCFETAAPNSSVAPRDPSRQSSTFALNRLQTPASKPRLALERDSSSGSDTRPSQNRTRDPRPTLAHLSERQAPVAPPSR